MGDDWNHQHHQVCFGGLCSITSVDGPTVLALTAAFGRGSKWRLPIDPKKNLCCRATQFELMILALTHTRSRLIKDSFRYLLLMWGHYAQYVWLVNRVICQIYWCFNHWTILFELVSTAKDTKVPKVDPEKKEKWHPKLGYYMLKPPRYL